MAGSHHGVFEFFSYICLNKNLSVLLNRNKISKAFAWTLLSVKGECIFHPVVRSCAQHPNLLTLVHHLLIVKLYFFIFFWQGIIQ